MRKIKIFSLLLLCGVVLLLGGCSGSQRRGQVLRIPLVVEPTTMDPAVVQDGPTIEVLMHIYDGLVEWNERNEVVPAIAERWEVSPDGRTYTFYLRKNVRFHNGKEVTAEDFRWSLNRALRPETASTVAPTYLNDIVGAKEVMEGRAKEAKGIKALGRYILQITIDRPRVYFLAKLTYPTGYVLDRESVEKDPRWQEHPVGTGPFKLKEWVHHSRVVLERNSHYFEGPPRLERIERPIILDAGTRHRQYETGELDMTDVPIGEYERDRKDPVLRRELVLLDRASVFYLCLNQKAFPPFRDRRVRQAFNYAIDKDALIRVVMRGVPRRADGILPPGIPGFDSHFRSYDYNPAKARALLAQAGYPNGRGFPPLTLTFRENAPDMKRFAEGLAEMYRRNLGIDVRLRGLEWGTFLQERNRGTMPFYFLRWAADYLDPQDFLSVMLHSGSPENGAFYSNPTFDRLCDQADGERDPHRRIQLYRQAERIAMEDAPWVPLYFQKDIELWKPYVKGVANSLMGHLPHKRTYIAQ